MSKNITIQEGGVAKQLTVDKLKTDIVGGGSCLWVPEDEVQLTTKHISENGTYKASADGYYGYSEVTVNGIGTVSGKDPDTGEDVVVSADPETGEIVETTVPHSIRILTPPTNPAGVYQDGEAITKDGMVVLALLASGSAYVTPDYQGGVIPIEELTLDPNTAAYDKDNPKPGEYTSSLLDAEVNAGRGTFDTSKATQYMATGEYVGPETVSRLGENGIIVVASTSSGTIFGYKYYDQDGNPTGSGQYMTNQSWTYDNKTVYYSVGMFANFIFPVTDVDPNQVSQAAAKAAWTMIYGTIEKQPGSGQTITVSWPRPVDLKVLETTFEITVENPAPYGGFLGGN